MTQCDKILAYMNNYGSITPLDALREFGCMRLAARINDLSNNGIQIKSEIVSRRNRDGDVVKYARYSLCEAH